ncbi:MAG: DUF983 domain-containing protein [Flavobacteriales bacterium]|nr:DUF983 domain-containing protein [Flavobacteriales bacterium]MCB9168252.1 DUF983 domain-containing protein [Flavobacteriales bacterium]
MTSKGGKLYSILRFKCPHCHVGEFFVDRNPYALRTAGEVLPACPVCHRSYSREPGFYYGAMYVAYGLAVATFVTIYVVISVVVPTASTELLVGGVLVGLFGLGPLLYAVSKTIWANIFFSYQGPPSENTPVDASDAPGQIDRPGDQSP